MQLNGHVHSLDAATSAQADAAIHTDDRLSCDVDLRQVAGMTGNGKLFDVHTSPLWQQKILSAAIAASHLAQLLISNSITLLR